MSFEAEDIKKAQGRMESARSNFDTLREETAGYVLPRHAHINGSFQTGGQQRTDKQYDEYAAQALIDGASAFEGHVMPEGQMWQLDVLPDEELMKDLEVRRWCEMVSRRRFSLRYDPKSGFTNNMHESVLSLLGLGDQSTWIDIRYDAMGRVGGLSYQNEHIDGIWYERDSNGEFLRIHRKFVLTAEAAFAKWANDAPEKVRDAMGDNRGSEEMEFIHVIAPNLRRDTDLITMEGMPWHAAYYSCSDQVTFQRGGHWSLPRICSSYDRASNEQYGRSPCFAVLPAIRACQIIQQDRIWAAEINAKGQYLATDDSEDQIILDFSPFGVMFGGLDERGNPVFQRLDSGADMTGADQLHSELRAAIDRALFRDLFQINREQKTHITATRTVEEIAEKGIMLAPLARQQNEFLTRMHERETELMDQLSLLDPMPRKVEEFFDAGGGLDVRYDNQLSRMREAQDVLGLMRTADIVQQMAPVNATVVDQFNRAFPSENWLPKVAAINGMPASWESSDDDKKKFDAQRDSDAQLAQLLEAAPTLAEAAKKTAEAGAINAGA